MKNSLVEISEYCDRIRTNLLYLISCSSIEDDILQDLNSVQKIILYKINNFDKNLKISDLKRLRCYNGTNISYNLTKLCNGHFLEKFQSKKDEREFYVRVTEKGKRVCIVMEKMLEKQNKNIHSIVDMDSLKNSLTKIDEYLSSKLL